jgi:hypothetical protein
VLEESDGLAAVDVGTLVVRSRMMDVGRDGGSCSEEWCVQYAQTPGGYLHVVEEVPVEAIDGISIVVQWVEVAAYWC